MRERKELIGLIGVVVVLLLVFSGSSSWAKRERHDVSLERANKNRRPYTRVFSIKVTRPGEVRIHAKIKYGVRDLVGVALYSLNNGKFTLLTRVRGKKGRETIIVRYSIDDPMLMKTNEYKVMVSNYNRKKRARVDLLISYPVAGEEQRGAGPVYPDLSIRDVSLGEGCNVQVTLANDGPGRLASVFWEKDSPTLKIYRNGRFWGGSSLKALDPDRNLSRKGGLVVYRSRMKISKETDVKVVLDMGPRARDENPGNNSMEKKLRCLGPPDLVIEKISLTRDCRVYVIVKNVGGALSPSFWEGRRGPGVYLYVGGRGWGGAALKAFDPRRRLARPGGKAVYKSSLKVGGTVSIRAVVDNNQVVSESNETNNGLEVQLSCRQ